MEISRRSRRWIYIHGVIILLVLIGAYGIAPLVTTQLKIRDELRDKQASLAKYQLAASEKERYQNRVNALRATLQQGQGVLFVGEKLPVAAAEIQGLLHTLGQESGITIVRENVRPPKKVEMLTEVTVELSIQGDIRGVRDFLYKIQTAPKLLTLPKVVIHGMPVRGPTGVGLELLVAGYILSGEEGAPAALQSSLRTGTRSLPEEG
jgi:Tfp pilus assembly protein PilO